ncbi:DNA replication/repair protein RecF [Sphingomonas sp.]|uniref:DNA replication/repair protein RecF n=1 Tax=Sphingomonas sp. TaxID=28214 RepID=UPI0035C792BB
MLARLVLTDVRNHAALTLEGSPGLIAIAGPNGAGKTNVLEAISLLAPGRGLRRAVLSAVARSDGPGGFGIAATLADGVTLSTGAAADAPERRVVKVNGAAAGANTLADYLSVLWLTPAMDRLFVEPASERRRFVDRLTLALAPAHAGVATRYEAAMRDRNRLLAEERPDPRWLDALEARMAAEGATLDAARRDTVALLGDRLGDEADFPRAALALDRDPVAPEAFARALRDGRARDAAAGRTLAGPHRVDLHVTHVDKAIAAAQASTGEQKALLLAIILAHAELVADRTGRAPVLLLDEVAAHLDPDRRAALFARLAGRGQVWMTGTEPALFDAAPDLQRIALG